MTRKEVSCRVLDVFFREASKKNVDSSLFAQGTPYPIEHFRNKHERIAWSDFVIFMANVGKHWNDEELIAFGRGYLSSPVVRSIFLPARLLFSTPGLFRWSVGEKKGGGNQLFSCVKNHYRVLDPRRATLDLSLPEGYLPCREFFLVSQGTFQQLPTLLGLAPAAVSMKSIPSGAHYEIEFPPEGGIAPYIRRILTRPFASRIVAQELKEANEALLERYEELEDYRLNLEKKVEERTNELARTVTELKEAQEARDKLFANINHEIRTPLSLISLSISDVKRRRTDVDARTQQQFDGIEGATRQLLRLVDGLLVLAASQEDRLRLRMTTFDIAARAKNTVGMWTHAAEALGVTIGYDGPEELAIHADETAVDRILTNLLSNALKFTPAGGSVSVELSALDGNMQLAVRDTGVGVDEEFKKRIFGRFEQGRAAVHAGSHGSGVGLSLVRELSRAHGGDVALQTPASGGSRFVVTLPTKPAPAALASISPREEAVSAQVPADFGIAEVSPSTSEILEPPGVPLGTIVIAEDDPALRAQVAELLRTDYRVLVAPDGISALNLARKHLPDMLVSDIGMPGMDGIELTRRFRDMSGNRLAPVLLLTAFGEVRKRLQGFEAGAVDYILKPFEPEELRARIRSQLLLRSLALRLSESEKSVTLGVLSAGLAHELRNPANGIANAIGPLRKLLPAESLREDSTSGKLFRVVEQCTEQLSVLSRQLLGLRSGAEMELVTTPVPELVSRAQSLASAALAGCRVDAAIDYTGTLACAPSTILQVLANLLENAAHASGPGGWVKISAVLDAERVVFEIADSGPGVPTELRQKIFEPFFTTKPPGIGTGLGLATAREIVVRHAGALEVRSGSPGAVFRVELPVHGPPAPAARRSAS